jgi:hypothetical protein
VASGQFPGGKWLLKGLHYIAEKAAQVVTKHAKRLLKWLSFASTCTLRAAFSIMFRLQRIELNEVKGCSELERIFQKCDHFARVIFVNY